MSSHQRTCREFDAFPRNVSCYVIVYKKLPSGMPIATVIVPRRTMGEGFMKKTQGFTLVEIAIVLVIIGLLLGGILKGQEMITQAKIKNVIADFSGISAAYHGYVDRYKKIPGDDPCAGTTNSAITVGNCGTTT